MPASLSSFKEGDSWSLKTDDILNLDCREKENRWLVAKVLRKLPMFANSDKITVDDLEKLIFKIRNKYPLRLSYILPTPDKEEHHYSFMVIRSDNCEWIKTIYACSIYEGFAKTAIFLWAYIKKNFKKEE